MAKLKVGIGGASGAVSEALFDMQIDKITHGPAKTKANNIYGTSDSTRSASEKEASIGRRGNRNYVISTKKAYAADFTETDHATETAYVIRNSDNVHAD